jgi:hypothetical protein
MNNLDFINYAIENYGATHILTIDIKNIHSDIKEIITRKKHSITMGGRNYDIIWNTDKLSNLSIFYTVSELPDIIINAHTRKVILNTIYEYHRYIKDENKKNIFANTNMSYSITKTTGVINNLSIKEILQQV